MSRTVLFALICIALTAVSQAVVVDTDEGALMRGDVNDSGSINNTDVVYLSNYLYGGGPPPPCHAQADVNDSGSINNTDIIYLSNYLYSGGPAPPGPNGDYCP